MPTGRAGARRASCAGARCWCARSRSSRSSAWCAGTSPALAGASTRRDGTVCGVELPDGLQRGQPSCPSRSSPRRPRPRRRARRERDLRRRGRRARGRSWPATLRDTAIELYSRAPAAGRAARDHPGGHEVRVRPARRRGRARRRGADAGLLALLAGRRVGAGRATRRASTSSSSATTRPRPAGTRPPPAPSCPTTSWQPPARSTSRPTSASPAARSTTGSPADARCRRSARRPLARGRAG